MCFDLRYLYRTTKYLLGGAVAVFGGFFLLQFTAVAFSDDANFIAVEVGHFDAPIAIVTRPFTEELFLAERAGLVRRIELAADGTFLSNKVLLDISAEVTTEGEGGLVGLAVSPAGDQLYLSYTDIFWQSKIVSLSISAQGELVDTPRLLIAVDQPHIGHNNGHLVTDSIGRLLVGFGDGGSHQVQDPYGHSRDRTTLLGSLLRILPTPDGADPYSVPRDNPFVGEMSSNLRPEIIAYGLRNPWRFDLDSATGDLWISDVGHQMIEEINYLEANDLNSGADFGWSLMEGSTEFNGPEPAGHVQPIYSYRHDGIDYRCAVIGGVVVRGGHLPSLEGAYLFSDLCDGRIRAIRHSGDKTSRSELLDLEVVIESPVSFSLSRDGHVYILSLTGDIFRLDPA